MSLLLVTPARTAFLPISIANCYVWIDPNDNTTITQAGGKASQINDKSGNGYNFTQPTSTAQPAVTANAINGRQAFTFTTSGNKAMNVTMGANQVFHSVFALIKPTNWVHSNAIFTQYATSNDLSLEQGTNTNSMGVYATSSTEYSSAANTVNPGTTYMVGYTYSGAGSGLITMYINGVSSTSFTQGSIVRGLDKNMAWGYSTTWAQGTDSVMGDLCVYTRTLTSTEVLKLYTNFYKPKWGLP